MLVLQDTYWTKHGAIKLPGHTVDVGGKTVTVPEDIRKLAHRLGMRRALRYSTYTSASDYAYEHMVRWAYFRHLCP